MVRGEEVAKVSDGRTFETNVQRLPGNVDVPGEGRLGDGEEAQGRRGYLLCASKGTVGVWLVLVALAVLVPTAPTWARPYGVEGWGQKGTDRFLTDYQGKPTDLYSGTDQLNYDELHGKAAIDSDNLVCDDTTRPPWPYDMFTQAHYANIVNGEYHCAPTSFCMAHNYWHTNTFTPKSTFLISYWARYMDTNDVNEEMHSGDHQMHFGTYNSRAEGEDACRAAENFHPGGSWWHAGKYKSRILEEATSGSPLTDKHRSRLYGQIRLGRPTPIGILLHKTGEPDVRHFVTAIDFHPDDGVTVLDPLPMNPLFRETLVPWADMWHYNQMTPQGQWARLPGSKVFFSNDNFSTGQANAQVQGGDPGDVYGSDLDGKYGLKFDDTPNLLADGTSRDYNAFSVPHSDEKVTGANELPFDMDAMDVMGKVQRITCLTYSMDHGDPNPHLWIPGTTPGTPSYQPKELSIVIAPNSPVLYTAGVEIGKLMAVKGTEPQLGLNYQEEGFVKGLHDDDVDAVELEFNDQRLAYSIDFVDLRVFPEYEDFQNDTSAPGFWAPWFANNEHPLDPTDIYWRGPKGVFKKANGEDVFAKGYIDGEADMYLSDHTDVDAIQFISLAEEAWRIDGVLFSVDADAPEHKDRDNKNLVPGAIYLSFLDGRAPVLFLSVDFQHDLDALVGAGEIPEPATMMLLALGGLAVLRRRRRWVGC